ncbi:invasion associated locus B family protein [Azospirillum rugosum]|uniref:invasion associated locus B family protein n=1 Tax=Azospirillum rugosum TaxID=416170 RepID=UPI001AE5B783|nr:invasion associated locus B family protein [Azospirillum rugosum]
MGGAWRSGLIVAGAVLAITSALPRPTMAQAPASPNAFREVTETFKDWKLYCQVWSAPKRLECELGSRPGSDRRSRLVWLRSSERWLEGLRFRLDDAGTDLGRKVRVWVDDSVFRPEFPCQPFTFESNTCAVSDPATNQKLVEKLLSGKEVSAVGVSPAGTKSEVRFSLNGFKAAVERMEQIRREAGGTWM